MIAITNDVTGSFVPNENIATNMVSNRFIPIIVLNDVRSYNNRYEDSIKTYYKPSHTRMYSKANSSKNIIDSLTYSRTMNKYSFGTVSYLIGKGFIMDMRGNILMVLAAKAKYFQAAEENIHKTEDTFHGFTYDNYIMLVSSSLPADPVNSVFYRRLQKIYLNNCFEKGMEVRYLSSSVIEKNTFASSIRLRFNSISELDYHLRNEVKHFLMTSEESAVTAPLHIDIPPNSVQQERPITIIPPIDIESYSPRVYGNLGGSLDASTGSNNIAIGTRTTVNAGIASTPLYDLRDYGSSYGLTSNGSSFNYTSIDSALVMPQAIELEELVPFLPQAEVVTEADPDIIEF